MQRVEQQQIFNRLQQADWNSIYRKLAAYAVHQARIYRWRGMSGNLESNSELIGGVSCEDIVQEVIIKTLQGKRKWDPDKGELEPWLFDQIKSEMNHLVTSSTHVRERISISEELDKEPNTASSTTHVQSASVIVLNEIEAAERLAAVYDATVDDPQLEELVSAILDGCEPKPRFLAERLGVDVKDIYNRTKRLHRRVFKDSTT